LSGRQKKPLLKVLIVVLIPSEQGNVLEKKDHAKHLAVNV